MPTYEFWYDETYTYKAWLDADSQEEAEALLVKVRDGEIHLEGLPEFDSTDKGYELLIDTTSIEEVK